MNEKVLKVKCISLKSWASTMGDLMEAKAIAERVNGGCGNQAHLSIAILHLFDIFSCAQTFLFFFIFFFFTFGGIKFNTIFR